MIVTMALNCMAEQVVVSAQQCIPKPPTWSHAECAGFSVGYFTAYHGLVQRGGAKAGDTVLVTGASGGMGIIAVQLAKVIGTSWRRRQTAALVLFAFIHFIHFIHLRTCVPNTFLYPFFAGCTVIGVVSTPAKADIVRKAGADHVVVVSAETSLKQTVMKLTQDRGVDIVYDVVGGNGFKDLIGVTARGGRILVIGFASGVIPKIPANLLLVKSISIVGVAAGAEMQRDPSLALEMVNQFISWAFPNKNRGAEADSVKGGQGGVDLRALVPRTIVTVPCDEESIKKLYSDLAGRASLGKGVVMWKPDADKVPALPPSRTVGAAGEGGQLQSKL